MLIVIKRRDLAWFPTEARGASPGFCCFRFQATDPIGFFRAASRLPPRLLWARRGAI